MTNSNGQLRPSRDQLVSEVAEFAAKITPADERWAYACRASASWFTSPRTGAKFLAFPDVCLKPLERVVGQRHLRYPLCLLNAYGSLENAKAFLAERQERLSLTLRDRFAVGPLEAWHLGHVYFARLRSMPHIVKVGFSRRLHDRLDDIESQCRMPFGRVSTKVGTMADEAWWHHNWRAHKISGEWFFAPDAAERTLPDFLAEKVVA